MELVRLEDDTRRARPFSTLRQAIDPHRGAHHRPAWHEPVRRITSHVNVDALRQQEQDRKKEARLEHALAMQLIDIGYKVLATKLHPDKGGSASAMSRLNRVRQRLRQLA